jgi:REP element-mobilizing transposase RayT
MSQQLSYELPGRVFFITIRTLGSRLWLVNNKLLETVILAYLAKYQKMYKVKIYGFIIMGNHLHLLAGFPEGNKAQFMRSFGAITAKAVIWNVPGHGVQRVWARRYASQAVLDDIAILGRYAYLATNPISSGLCSSLSEYNGYNSFRDQAAGVTKRYKLVDYKAYHDKQRWCTGVDIRDYTHEYELEYSRLPGQESLSDGEYQAWLRKEVRDAGDAARQRRVEAGKGFGNRALLRRTKPGQAPRHTKRSQRHSFRPLVFCTDRQRRESYLAWYFELVRTFKEASVRYLAGENDVEFPVGTYPPCRVGVV